MDESIALMRQAGILDPRNNDIWVNLARSYRGQRKFSEAHAMFDHARTIAARVGSILAEKAEAYTAAGDLERAERLLAPLPLDLDHEAFNDYVNVFVVRRDFDRAFALLAEGLQKPAEAESKFFAQLQVAYLQAQVGRLQEAKPVLLAARQRIEGLRAAGDESLWLRDELLQLAATLGDHETVQREGKELLEITARDKWRHPAIRGNRRRVVCAARRRRSCHSSPRARDCTARSARAHTGIPANGTVLG